MRSSLLSLVTSYNNVNLSSRLLMVNQWIIWSMIMSSSRSRPSKLFIQFYSFHSLPFHSFSHPTDSSSSFQLLIWLSQFYRPLSSLLLLYFTSCLICNPHFSFLIIHVTSLIISSIQLVVPFGGHWFRWVSRALACPARPCCDDWESAALLTFFFILGFFNCSNALLSLFSNASCKGKVAALY